MFMTVRDVDEAFKLLGYLDAGLKPGELAVFAGPAFSIAKRVIQKYEDAHDCKRRVWRDIDHVRLTTSNGGRIEFRPVGDGTRIRALRSDVLVVIDPMSVPADVMLTIPHPKVVLNGEAELSKLESGFKERVERQVEKAVDAEFNRRDLVQPEPAPPELPQPPCRLTFYSRVGGHSVDITIEGPDSDSVAAMYEATRP